MKEKFSKETEILKNNQEAILKIKTSTNQVKTILDSIVSREDQTEERYHIWRIRLKRYCTQTTIKGKNEYI
jgi:hypothetical protein